MHFRGAPEKIVFLFLIAILGAVFLVPLFMKEGKPGFAEEPVWEWTAGHEGPAFAEYGFVHSSTSYGRVTVRPDPTDSGRGGVAEGMIWGSPPGGDSHRLYGTIEPDGCPAGPYRCRFLAWMDRDSPPGGGWLSLATFAHVPGWADLFGLMIVEETGAWKLGLFHVPRFGLGDYERLSEDAFPLREWVRIDIEVGSDGLITVGQNGKPVLRGRRDFGPEGPRICGAHWGLYADGRVGRAIVLNDDVQVRVFRRPR